jgi:hypothetical protein
MVFGKIISAEILPSGMMMIDKGTSAAIYDPVTGQLMLDNIPHGAPPVIAKSERYLLSREKGKVVLDHLQEKKIVREWREFK